MRDGGPSWFVSNPRNWWLRRIIIINAYMGKEVTAVSDCMESCTKQISYHPQVLPDTHPTCPGRRVVLIDTPGFDDTYSPPNETLRMVSVTALAST
jgi:hypothetical protein